jgi:hypothetical protein
MTFFPIPICFGDVHLPRPQGRPVWMLPKRPPILGSIATWSRRPHSRSGHVDRIRKPRGQFHIAAVATRERA